jgi:cytochrome c
MKKSFLIIALCTAIAACSSNSSNNNSSDSSSTKQDAVAQNSSASADTGAAKNGTEAAGASSKGESLMAGSDCSTCHRPDMKLVGPSFKEIANKYTAADVDKLAAKVIKGGSGSWGDVSMTAHVGLSEDDAKEMVKYILTQK